MLDTVKINHVQHISFTQSRLTDAVSVILRELLSYEHPSKGRERDRFQVSKSRPDTSGFLFGRIKGHRYKRGAACYFTVFGAAVIKPLLAL